ncbi:MAG: aminotransferase class V-fold PLP-dependent enzyme [Candidatus Neomarinimicrobiota bacterium]
MDLLDKIQTKFIGLDTVYRLADGRQSRRIYLDSTASTLMMKAAYDAVEEYYQHYANTHSLLHFSARISTDQYRWAHERILSFLNADPERYTCFFTGSGSTAAINRIARVFRDYRPDRGTAFVSLMEHHSNDLPHRKHARKVVHIPFEMRTGNPGCIDLTTLKAELERNSDSASYVAVTGVSNVTGIINPVHDIAELAHKYGAFILVDGAQMAAHLPVRISGHANPTRNLDAFVFSGHKTYVPGSPGVVICRKDILSALEPEEVGGGMVDQVFVEKYTISSHFPDREEAGTPNIPGAIGLAAAIEVLDTIGMQTIYKDEDELIRYALEKIQALPGLAVYGETNCDSCPRAASISFNILGIDHGLVAAVLNDYHCIAVRNECFCAHPYVKEMIMDYLISRVGKVNFDDFNIDLKIKAGMVRASFGLYSTRADVDALVAALEDIVGNIKKYTGLYHVENSNYIHNEFRMAEANPFSVREFVHQELSR